MNIFSSKELSTVHEFLQLENQLVSSFGDDPKLPSLRPILDGLGSTTMLFGLCELNDKRVVRRMTAMQKDVLSTGFIESKNNYQELGLISLQEIIDRSKLLEKELSDQSGTVSEAHIKSKLQEARLRFNLYLSDSELKGSDIKKLNLVFDEVEFAFNKSEKAVGELVNQKLIELQKLRKSPDRGNVENIPIWKLVSIAVYVGVGLTYVIRCILLDRCSRGEKAFFYLTALILGISLKFC
jgi:hypothetical protein